MSKTDNKGDGDIESRKVADDEYVSNAFSKLAIQPPSMSRRKPQSSIFMPSSKTKYASLKKHPKRRPENPETSQKSTTQSSLQNLHVIDPTFSSHGGKARLKRMENKPDVFFVPVPVDSPSWNGKAGPHHISRIQKPVVEAPSQLVDHILKALSAAETEQVLPELDIKGLDATLLPHQLLGVDFLQKRELKTADYKGFCGGLLCDDMGLGKTIQIIALMVYNRLDHPTLVLCPVSLATQWASEIKKFAPDLRVLHFHGPKRPKDYKNLKKFDVVISSYETIRAEWVAAGKSDENSRVSVVFHSEMQWGRVVLDEAHIIKNGQSKTARACFDINAKYRWCLTGTPIQNNLNDMQSLFQFLRLSELSDVAQWKKYVSNAVAGGNFSDASQNLITQLKPMMLRRTKQILNPAKGSKPSLDELASSLPEKRYHLELLELPPLQRRLYEEVRNRYIADFADQFTSTTSKNAKLIRERSSTDPCEHYYELRSLLSPSKLNANKNHSSTTTNTRMQILVHLLRLRQLCCDWQLLTDTVEKKSSESLKAETLKCSKESDDESMVKSLSSKFSAMTVSKNSVGDVNLKEKLAPNKQFPSAKVLRLLNILENERYLPGSTKPRKTIVFSQFTQMLILLRDELRKHNICSCCYFGSMSITEKDRIKTLFKNDSECEVMLCSLKSGSLGLNLTMANRVILFDPWWNPAIQEQAIDRVYRIGQKSSRVDVHVLIMRGTVEEEIIKLQDHKRNLAKMVADGDADAMRKLYSTLTTQELIKLFGSSQE